MSERNDDVSLRHMLDYAREALLLIGDRNLEALEQDRLRQLGLARLVEILGEAANRVSAPTRGNHPQIPWKQIVGMRNRLIHGYDLLDLDMLWRTSHDDLPPLIGELEKILNPR